MRLTERQAELLRQWDNCDIGMGFHFKDLSVRTEKSRAYIASIVRELAGLGYLEFKRGCWTDDGEMYGSAYLLTTAGRAALAQGGGE